MLWKLRHEGSPKAVEGLQLSQVLEGLQDGRWEGDDEVMGPADKRWYRLEEHPTLADTVEEIAEASRRPFVEEETSIDMVPLIDVCMVLLVFFILTTSYQALEKILNMPAASAETAGPAQVTQEQLDSVLIKVEVKREPDGSIGYYVQDTKAKEAELTGVIARWVKETRRTEVLILAGDVDWGSIAKVIDACSGARVQRVKMATL